MQNGTITPRALIPGIPLPQKPKAPQIRQAEKRVAEILEQIHYATSSLTHDMIKAYRAGMTEASGENAYALLRAAILESEEAWGIAIQQPEQRPAIRPVVEL